MDENMVEDNSSVPCKNMNQNQSFQTIFHNQSSINEFMGAIVGLLSADYSRAVREQIFMDEQVDFPGEMLGLDAIFSQPDPSGGDACK